MALDNSTMWRSGALYALAVFSGLMIISDCYALFGAVTLYFKYFALIVLAIYMAANACRKGLSKYALVLSLVGLTLLIVSVPFQTASFSIVQSFGLYLLVFCFAAFSRSLSATRREIAVVSIFSAVLVLVLCLVSFQDCISQLSSGFSRLRMKGCFSNANSLGHICSILIILHVALYELGLEKKLKKVIIFDIFFLTIILLLTGSQTARYVTLSYIALRLYFNKIIENPLCSKNLKAMATIALIAGMISLCYLAPINLAKSNTFMLRFETLVKMNLQDPRLLFGFGYVSSDGVAEIVTEAGGAVEMLFVSLIYRVGIVGLFAYLLLWSACFVGSDWRSSHGALISVIVALFLQSVGESYMSSVMSFVSAWDWLLLSLIPSMYLLSLKKGQMREESYNEYSKKDNTALCTRHY